MNPILLPGGQPIRDVTTLGLRLVRFGRAVAFWVGVVLPLVYLPLVVAGVVNVGLYGFVGLVALNYAVLFVGSSYGDGEEPWREESDSESTQGAPDSEGTIS